MTRKNTAPTEGVLDELLTDPQGAQMLKIGLTRFLQLQQEADFPPPIWLGPRGKRHVRAALAAYALSKRQAPVAA